MTRFGLRWVKAANGRSARHAWPTARTEKGATSVARVRARSTAPGPAALLALAAALFVPVASSAQDLPVSASPELVGLSSARLERLTSFFKDQIAKRTVPGAVVLIARRGRIAYFETFGLRDPETKEPMARDTIFRIASLSKPIASTAAMILAEEGRVILSDPVSRYLPKLAGLKVGVEKRDQEGHARLELEPAAREMTIHDLLRHTSGLTYNIFGKTLVKSAYTQANIQDVLVGGSSDRLFDCDGFVERVARLPLAHQPGTTWDYSISTDLLGCVVQAVSGQTLGAFVQDRIVAPLKLPDTGFFVPKANQGRLAESFVDPTTGRRTVSFIATEPPKFFSGGGGMVSTAADYARFLQMLLNEGELDGVRLLSRTTVAAMTTNQLPPSIRLAEQGIPVVTSPTPEQGQGWGLAFNVRTARGISPLMGSEGSYYWSGIYGPYFWVDPKEQLVVVLMTQSPDASPLRPILRQLVYQAIVD